MAGLVAALRVLWPAIALGAALALLSAWAGWMLGRYRSLLPVRWTTWWVLTVVGALAACRWWALRALLIFANNIAILSLLLAIGSSPGVAIVGAAFLGASVGVALRVIGETPWDFAAPTANGHGRRAAFRLGIWLNGLEPPAIVLALGLSIARGTGLIATWESWAIFALWVVPPMLVAAAGEALWLGIGLSAPPASQPDETSFEPPDRRGSA